MSERGLGALASIAVFVLLCMLALGFLLASVRASGASVGPIVDIGGFISQFEDEDAKSSQDNSSSGKSGQSTTANTTDDDKQSSDGSAKKGNADDDGADDGSDASAAPTADLEKGYFYNQLGSDDKGKYEAIYQMLASRTDVDYPGNDPNEMGKMFNFVMGDHPEIFYANFLSSTSNSGVTSSHISGKYHYSESQIADLSAKLDKAVQECISGVPAGADDFEKAKYVYDYLINHVKYNHKTLKKLNSGSAPSYEKRGQTAVNALVEGDAVCAGYARAYQLVMQELGYTCAYIVGDLKKEEGSHAWCLLQLGGDYYYVDPTWGDHDANVSNKDVRSWDWSNYGYLCTTTNVMRRSRSFESWQPLPDCTATKNNYYVKKKRLLAKADSAKVVKWGNKALSKGQTHFQFRCKKKAVYQSMINQLKDGVPFNGYPQYYYQYYDDSYVIEVVFN